MNYLKNSPYESIVPTNINKESLTEFTELILQDNELDDAGWTVVWDNHHSRMGYCNYETRQIGLSEYILKVCINPIQMVDTVLHEIAHALTPLHGHNRTWKNMAMKLGANPFARQVVEKSYDEDTAPMWAMIDTRTFEIVHHYKRKPWDKTMRECKFYGLKSDSTAKGHLRVAKTNKTLDTLKWDVFYL